MLSDRYRLLLILAAALTTIKFALLPWLDWQGEKISELKILTDRLERSLTVQKNRDVITTSRELLNGELREIRKRFPNVASVADYRLEAQQNLAALASRNTVVMQSHEWVLEREVIDSAVRCLRWRAGFSGSARNMASFQVALETTSTNLIPLDFVLNPSGPLMNADGAVALSVTADSCIYPESAQ